MARAVCASCRRVISWRAQRGTRLADLRCPCGGELRGMTAGRPSRASGQHYGRCGICGSRRLGHRLVSTTRDWTSWNGQTISAGALVCSWHDVRVPAEDLPDGWRFASVRTAEAELARMAGVSA